MNRNITLAYALKYANLGIPIFPVHTPNKNGGCSCGDSKCNSVGKHPMTRNGLKDATDNREIISEWWTKHPDANIGIPTDTFFVLDIDEGGEEELKKHPLLPDTVESITGIGRHLFFKKPKNMKIPTKIKLFKGLDIKGEGGYVIVPPSLHKNGNRYKYKKGESLTLYKLANSPKWLLEAIKSKPSNPAKTGNNGKLIPEGERNETLFRYGCSLRGKKLNEQEINNLIEIKNKDLCSPPLDKTELDKITESVFRYENNNKAFEDVTTLDNLMKMDFPEPTWIIPSLIPEGLTLVSGRPKIGKSIFCVNLSVAIATGGKALGKIDVEKTGVLYVALEDTLKRLQNRFKAVLKDENPPDNLHLKTNFKAIRDGGLNELDTWLTENKDVGFVIIDTLARIKGQARKGSDLYIDDYEAVAKIKQVADHHSTAILVIHHTRKAESEDIFDSILGTTGIGGAADTLIVLKKKRFDGITDSLTMYVTGRDVEEKELAVSFNRPALGWVLEGDAKEYFQSKQRRAVLDILKAANGKPVQLRDITTQIRKKSQATYSLVKGLMRDGLINKVGKGLYVVRDCED